MSRPRKTAISNLFRLWRRIDLRLTRPRVGRNSAPGQSFNDEPPLRAELFSSDQMEQHGLRLASAHRLTPGRVPDRLLARLAANEGVLTQTCHRLTTAVNGHLN